MKGVAVGCQTPPIPPDHHPPPRQPILIHTPVLLVLEASSLPPAGGGGADYSWITRHLTSLPSTVRLPELASRIHKQLYSPLQLSFPSRPHPSAASVSRVSPSPAGPHRLPQAWPELRSHLRAPRHPPEDQRLLPTLLALLQLRPWLECLKIKLISPSPV